MSHRPEHHIAAARAWLRYAASWQSFPRPTHRTLQDVCRYCTRDDMLVTYVIPANNQQGAVAFHVAGKCIVLRAGFTARALLTHVEQWAARVVRENQERAEVQP